MNDYQTEAARTLTIGPDFEKQLAVMGLGLAGEAGEVIELIKKAVGHGHPLNPRTLQKELGDVLWYVAAIATLNGLSLGDIADANIAKLKARYPDGFSSAASIARADTVASGVGHAGVLCYDLACPRCFA